MSEKVPEQKKKTVQEFADLMDKYPVVGVINMRNLPTKQLQSMRAKLRDSDTIIKMTKKRLLKLSFEKTNKKDLGEIQDHFKGLPALIFTNDNPFGLYSDLQKTKSSAPAKPGQEAPKDVVIPAGPTGFSPGPVIGQLGKYGIKTGVEAGKIVIQDDAVVAKKGDIIDVELAGILSRMGIEPMEIGLDLVAVYENGTIFTSDQLHIDIDDYVLKFATSYSDSLNLAVYVGYANEETINILLGKAFNDAKALALSQSIINDVTAKEIIMKAHKESLSLSNNLPEVKTEEKQEKKEVTPKEDILETKVSDDAQKSEKVSDKPEEKKEEEN